MIRAELAIACLLADGAAFTLVVGRFGASTELNPFAVALYGAAGLNGVLVAKVIQALLAGAVAHRLRARRWSLLPAIAGLVGAGSAIAVLAVGG